ncbi:SpvB/TcaC N-terminal domain-containing protein [Sorangium cellulosum]|uniref:SpvB/TcaC N-terminal domain-containing protein n=1 Tax=Sorangium cellulosum TaxID=56 RepID=UPI001F5D3118|nr:SpvB/TcaC N-terminal domain-containing protein [Sorangium cellulosum]
MGWLLRLAVVLGVVLVLGRGHEGVALAGPSGTRLLPLSPPGGGIALSAMPLRLPRDDGGRMATGPDVGAPPVPDDGAPHGEIVRPDEARVIAFDGAVLEIPQGAVDEPVRITIRPLDPGEVRPMGRAMVNVTPGGRAYRFGPHGLKFKKPVRLMLPYDEGAVPPGMTARHISGFYFDEALGQWERVARDGEPAQGKLASLTDHFTDFISATLAMPDAPGTRSFDPNSIKGLALGSPLAGVTLIAPPEAGSSGAARLRHAIEVPPGRNGIEPAISIEYDSEHRNGWLGVGWDLRLSSLEIDTRFGVPRYAAGEEPRYLLDGSELVPAVADGPCGDPCAYRRRVEGRFDRILRRGGGPTSYFWEVTDKDGTTYVYGRSASARLDDPEPGPDQPRNVFRWYLEEVRDTFGNQMWIHYGRDTAQGSAPRIEVHPERIEYTANASQDVEAAYAVDFVTEIGRPDVLLSGRPGFLERTAERLARVDVRFGNTVIRSYVLDYAQGDFGKSLLRAIALHGRGTRQEDGQVALGQELYRHTFDYFTAPRNAEGQVAAFAQAAEVWGHARREGGLSRSEDSTVGGSASVGLGIGPFSISVGGGGFSGDELVRGSVFDLNGDGMPDFLYDGGNAGLSFLRAAPGNHLATASVPGLLQDALGLTDRSGWSVHAGLNVAVLSGSVSYTRSSTEDERIVTDINGDGYPDLVSTGALGTVVAALNDRRGRFGSPAPWGELGLGAPSGHPDFAQAAREDFHPADPLLRWIAPFAGDIRIGGVVQKQAAGGDGVRVEIVQSGEAEPLFNDVIDGDDVTPCALGAHGCGGGALTTHVAVGDRIYFRVSAAPTIDPEAAVDTTADLLSWSPTITYVVDEAQLGQIGPDGAPLHHFDYSQDHRVAGRPDVPWVAPADGVVRILGDLTKQETSDDLWVAIVRERDGESESLLQLQRVGAEDGGLELDELRRDGKLPDLIPVNAGDRIRFRVRSDVPDDPALIAWDPVIRYEEYTRVDRATGTPRRGQVECGVQPNGQTGCMLHNDGPGDVPLPLSLIEQRAFVSMPVARWLPGARRVSWIAPSTGTARLDVSLFVPGANWSGNPLTLVVQGVHRLLYKHDFVALSSAGSFYNVPIDVEVEAGEPIYVAVFAGQIADGYSATAWIDGEQVPVGLLAPYAASEVGAGGALQDPMAGGFHGWSAGFINGDHAFSEDEIVFPTLDPERGFTLAVPLPDDETPVWGAAASDAFLGGGAVMPSIVGRVGRGQGRLGSLRSAETWNAEVAASLPSLGAGYSFGSTTSERDLIDINGDRLPDSVTREGAVLNTGRGFGPHVGFSLPEPLRRIEQRTIRLDVSGSITVDSGNETISEVASDGASEGFIHTRFGLGTSYGLSATHVDLIDINGDGLVDQVKQDPEGGAMTVAFNLGHRFTAPVPLARERFQKRDFEAGDLSEELGDILHAFTDVASVDVVRLEDTGADSIAPGLDATVVAAGAGYTYTTARTVVDFVDVNGDGLPDKVMKAPEEESFRVQLNLGSAFAPEESWPAGAWGVSIDPPEYTFMGGGDAVSFRRSESYEGSFSVEVCYFLCVGGSVFYSEGSGSSQLGFEDIDGDGLADHVLKRDGDEVVYARVNALGKTNLLRRVDRPLGGSVELDYRREGNLVVPGEGGPDEVDSAPLVDMPSSQWVLSDVTVRDGVEETPGVHGVHAYRTSIETHSDGIYDRDERTHLGYGLVTTTALAEDGVTAMSVEDLEHYNHDFYRRGFVARSTLRDGDGMLYTVEEIEHAPPPEGLEARVGWFFPRETRRESAYYEGTTDDATAPHKRTVETRDFDELGNLTGLHAYGEEDTADDDLHQTVGYTEPGSAYIVKPEWIETRDAEDRLLRKRTAEYWPGTGALRSVTNVISGGKRPDGVPYADAEATWAFAFDDHGNLETSTDPNGYTVTYGYDATTHSFRTCVSDSFGYHSNSVPNLLYGTVAQETDVNGHTMVHQYDEFGRLSAVWGPSDLAEESAVPVGCEPSKVWSAEELDALGAAGEPTVGFEYALQPDLSVALPAWAKTSHKDVQHPGDPIVTVTFADGLGRVLQTRKDLERDTGTGTEVGMSVSGAVAFDALGRVVDQGQPVFSTEPDTAFVAVEMLRPTHLQHDVLSRVRLVERPDTNAPDGYARTAIEHDLSMFEGRLLFEEMVIDANGKVRNTYRDVGGRIGVVEEFNRIEGVERQIVTRYEHNPLDELERVTDANGNVTQAAYDTVGRMVELVSPDAGRTEWRYDLVGNLRAKQDAELAQQGQVIRYEYEHNRLRKIDYPVTEDVVYTYGKPNEGGDAKGNRAGRVKEETSAAGTRSYGYDRYGNVAELTAEFPRLREPHRGPYEATMRYAFDALGRMQELRFPGSGEEVVRYGYDHGGLLITATGENQGINQQHPNEPRTTEYLRHIGYDEHGQRVRMVAGNGVETRYRYDESTRRLEDVDADHQSAQMRWMGRAPRPFQRLRYRYDLVGNILELNNEVPYDESLGGSVMVAATQQRFQYDDLNQLTDASGIYQERSNEQERYNLGLKYDVLGNVEEKGQEVAKYASDGRGGWNKQYEIRESTYRNAYRYNGPRPHAPREVDEYVVAESQPRLRELRYDASGRQIEWRYRGSPQRSLEWDEDGRLVLVKENNQEISRALYDGAGERRVHLHRVAGEEETAYVDQHLVLRNGQYATKHIFAGETRIASKLDADWLPVPPVLYYHPDHLGSTQYVTDADQALSQHAEYLPSGELWADQTDSRFQNRQPYLFNGKELDLSTGLYHYGARSYEPRLGVWLSPDPILDQYMRGAPNGGVYDPIHLGLFTYTRNNPLKFVDPTGLAETCVDGVCQEFVAPEDVSSQVSTQLVDQCASASCMSLGTRLQHWQEIDRTRTAAEDKPLEASLIDPIDVVGMSAATTLAKIGRKVIVRIAALKAGANAEVVAAAKKAGDVIHLPQSLGAAAKDLFVRGGGRLVSREITQVERIASGRGIREVNRLVREYGGKPANWYKMKGVAAVERVGGGIGRAEVHWYQGHGVGRVEFKVKKWLDL